MVTDGLELDAEVADLDLQLGLVLLELGGADARLLGLVLELGDARRHLATATHNRLRAVHSLVTDTTKMAAHRRGV